MHIPYGYIEKFFVRILRGFSFFFYNLFLFIIIFEKYLATVFSQTDVVNQQCETETISPK
ncbi:hypothetical protein BC670_0022 [Flavobacterium branchiophilum]|uniref:Uncharacterized protein n=1 Tax=Flavobacterium branchiophilum TaxID=55197 RepID=A0A543FZI8_9FLAO|nr:hypothetical protein BC670_0022 [Flavobacterium branchiophilum]